MFIDLSKNITKQLNSCFPEYSFNKTFENSFKLNLSSFFVQKLNDTLLSFPDFCFYIKLNSPDLNDISSISFILLNRFKLELLNYFHPNSFSLKQSSKSFSDFEVAFFNLAKQVSESESYITNGFSYKEEGLTNIVHLFFKKEQKKYITSFIKKPNTFNLSYFKKVSLVPLMSNEEIFFQRYLNALDIIKHNIYFINVNLLLDNFFNDKKDFIFDYQFDFSPNSSNDDTGFYFKIVNLKTSEEHFFKTSNSSYLSQVNIMIKQMKRQLLRTAEFLNITTGGLL